MKSRLHLLLALALVGAAPRLLHAAPPLDVGSRLGTVSGYLGERIRQLEFVEDGATLFCQTDESILFLDAANGEIKRQMKPYSIYGSRVSADGQVLLVAENGPDLTVTDFRDPAVLTRRLKGGSKRSDALAMDPQGAMVAKADDGQILLWDVKSGTLARKLDAKSATTLAFSPDGRDLASGGKEMPTKIWDAATGRERLNLKAPCKRAVFSPDGKALLLQNISTDKLSLFTLDGGAMKWESSSTGYNAAFSPDGTRIVAFQGGKMAILDAATGGKLQSLEPAARQNFMAAAYSPDGKLLVTGGADYRLRFWRTTDLTEVHPPSGHDGPVESVAFAPDGKQVVTGGRDGTVRFWSWPEGRQLDNIVLSQARNTGVEQLVFSAKGDRLAAYAQVKDQPVTVWDAHTRTQVVKLGRTETSYATTAMAFLPDQDQLLTGMGNGSMVLWDLASGKPTRVLGQPKGDRREPIRVLALMPDAMAAAWADGNSGTVFLRDLNTGQDRELVLKTNNGGPLSIAPDGTWLAVGTNARDFVSLEGLARNGAHGHDRPSAISSDGQMFAYVEVDGVRLWERLTREVLRSFDANFGEVHALAFSPDGRTLALGMHDGTVVMLDLAAVRADGVPAEPKSEQEFETLWRLLGGTDHSAANVARWSFAKAGDPAVAFLARKLAPAPPLTEAEIAGLKHKFTAPSFAERETAARTLMDRGVVLKPEEIESLRPAPPEGAYRLSGIGPPEYPPVRQVPLPDRLRSARAVTALENSVAPAAALALLEKLATGDQQAPQTREAAAALQRLKARR